MFTIFFIHDAIKKTITNAIGKDHWQMHTFKHHTYSTYIPTQWDIKMLSMIKWQEDLALIICWELKIITAASR